jgi:asparagine synthase (glutamine-hydrolysing)
VGIFHRDSAPIERALLQSLVDFLAYRGPDARETWMETSIGLGHTLLRTTRESFTERQPAVYEGRYWITADARLDGRAELLAELDRIGHSVPDSELILRAYVKWGSACVEHLRGDFSFAIWDSCNKRLFCARDQFGIKPFYYASVGQVFVFSNTLNCVRKYPTVSGRLNDLAISDFLLFDMIREPGATSFADIHRLPPAHFLVCEQGSISVRRYWTLPVSALHRKRSSECVEEFRELLDQAVADRLGTNRVGVLMSGGLDSTTVAASAQRTLARRGSAEGLCAYTEVHEDLIPHEERHYAGLVAEALKVPIEFHAPPMRLWQSENREDIRWPEPVHSPGSDGGLGQMRQIAARNRVVLTGYGGDPALSCLLSVHFLGLLKKGQLGRALTEAVRYLRSEGRFSRLYLRTRWRRWFASKGEEPHYPEWLNRDLEKSLRLRERWETLTHTPAPNTAAVRPLAYEAMVDPMWPHLFEGYDSGVTRVHAAVCHPFFDLRLVDFLLGLPALPWCSDKELLREAARGMLPDAVRLRRKSPLLADPLIALLQRPESACVDSFEPVPELNRYVERHLIPKVFGESDVWNAWIHLRPLSLNLWLLSK